MAGQITEIKVQKGNRDRVNVFLDGEFAFGVARSVADNLRVGDRMTGAALDQLKREDSVEDARRRAMRLIARRPRSELELRRYFDKRNIPEAVQQAALQRLKEGGWIDDWAFAQTWVENRTAFRPRGAFALKSELRQKGVSAEAIEAALDGFDERAAAVKAGRQAAKRYAKLSWERFRKQVGGYLGRRGFDFGMITTVVNLLWEEISELESEGSEQ